MLLTVRDVEAELQLGRTRTYELLRSGEIPVIRIGRVLRVPRDALHRWIDDKIPDQPRTPGRYALLPPRPESSTVAPVDP